MECMAQTVKWVSEQKGWVFQGKNITSNSVAMKEGDKMFGLEQHAINNQAYIVRVHNVINK